MKSSKLKSITLALICILVPSFMLQGSDIITRIKNSPANIKNRLRQLLCETDNSKPKKSNNPKLIDITKGPKAKGPNKPTKPMSQAQIDAQYYERDDY